MCPISTRDETEPKCSNAKLVEPPHAAKQEKILLLASASVSGAIAEAPAVQAPSTSAGKRPDVSCVFMDLSARYRTAINKKHKMSSSKIMKYNLHAPSVKRTARSMAQKRNMRAQLKMTHEKPKHAINRWRQGLDNVKTRTIFRWRSTRHFAMLFVESTKLTLPSPDGSLCLDLVSKR